jgi:hypothetical protein
MVVEIITEMGVEKTCLNTAKDLCLELNKGKLWRTTDSLCRKLQVERSTLLNWLEQPAYLSRLGKNNTVYYALADRVIKKSISSLERPIKEEDGYALAILHMIYFQLYKTLKTYGLEISQHNVDAFSNLTASLDKLETGLLLFSKKTKASMEKLPKFN